MRANRHTALGGLGFSTSDLLINGKQKNCGWP